NKPRIIPIGELVFDVDPHFGSNRKQRCKRDFPCVIIDYVIVVLTAFEQNPVDIHAFRAGNHQNVKFVVWPAKFVRPLVSFLSGKSASSILTANKRSRAEDFSAFFRCPKIEGCRYSLNFLVEVHETRLPVLEEKVTGTDAPSVTEKFYEYLIELVEFLRISTFLKRNIRILD